MEIPSGTPGMGLNPQDESHLNLLSLLHKVYAGLVALGGVAIAAVGVAGGFLLAAAPPNSRGEAPPAAVAGLVGGIYGCGGVIAILFAVVLWLCGNWIAERRNATGILVVSILNCLNIPLGAALGIFTLMVTQRPAVKASFR